MAGCIVLSRNFTFSSTDIVALGRATNADACDHREVTAGEEEPPCF